MKNFGKMFVVIAFMAIVGLIVSCEIQVSEPFTHDEMRAVDTDGRLTITGLDGYEGMYISAVRAGLGDTVSPNDDLVAFGQVFQGYLKGDTVRGIITETYGTVKNGQVTLKVYTYNMFSMIHGNYNGNDKGVLFNVNIMYDENDEENNDKMAIEGTVTVNFTNGIGSEIFVLTPTEE